MEIDVQDYINVLIGHRNSMADELAKAQALIAKLARENEALRNPAEPTQAKDA